MHSIKSTLQQKTQQARAKRELEYAASEASVYLIAKIISMDTANAQEAASSRREGRKRTINFILLVARAAEDKETQFPG